MMFQVEGKGHFLGHQYSITTDEPFFQHFMIVMEGNNEVDIDGTERALDYLGTEDSFTFSWGFQQPFAGLRAGMPLISKEAIHRLSLYRFHDHMPIRFEQSLTWKINWTQERQFAALPNWEEAWQNGGCWVDYATVHYWYQQQPAGYEHTTMEGPDERARPFCIDVDSLI